MTDHEPFADERQAHAAAVAAVPPEKGRVILSGLQNRQLVEGACADSGVELGAYDRRIIEWFSGWEDSTCAVLAGLIIRAHESGKAAAPAGAETEWALSYTYRPRLPGLPARRVVQPYQDEAMAREAVAAVRAEAPGDDPALMCREIGPWKEVPDV